MKTEMMDTKGRPDASLSLTGWPANAGRLANRAWRAVVVSVRLLNRLFWNGLAWLYPGVKWFVGIALVSLVIGLFKDYITEGFKVPIPAAALEFIAARPRLMLFAIGSVSALFFVTRVGHKRKEAQARLRAAFRTCLPVEELKLSDLGLRESRPGDSGAGEAHDGARPFFGTYFPRKVVEYTDTADTEEGMPREFSEEELEQFLRNGWRFLLVDLLYSGKTTTALQILRRMTGYTVVTPDGSKPVPEEEPFALLRRRRVVVLLDNLATLATSNYDIGLFMTRMARDVRRPCGLVGTCREGGDFAVITASHGNHVTYFCEPLKRFRLCPMTEEQRIELAATTGMPLEPKDARNHPLPGNITMRKLFHEMEDRFKKLNGLNRDALRAMKLLDTGGIPITISRLQAILIDVFHQCLGQGTIEAILSDLWHGYFLEKQPDGEEIRPHLGYLTYSVSYQEGRELEDERWDTLAQTLEKSGDAEAMLYLSHGHRGRGDLVRSLQSLDGVLRIDANNADAHFHHGYTLARLNRLDEALAANGRALELRQGFAEAYNNRCYILARLDRLPEALDAVDRALVLRPDFEDAHTNRAIVLARLGRFDEAMEGFGRALSFRPKSYHAYLNLGITLSRQMAFDEALAAFEQALTIRPDYPAAHLNRGITLARMGRHDEALGEHEQAIKLRPDYAWAYMCKGQTLAHLGRYSEAVQALSRAIELQPDHAMAYVNRARTYSHMGREYREAASRDWQTASALGAVPPRGNLVLGISLARHGALADALVVFDRAIESYADFPEALLNRGMTLARMDRFEEALDDFARALKLRPDYAEANLNRGMTLARMDRFEDALADFARALEIRPDYAEVHRNRGMTLARMERSEEALADFARAIELRPDYPEAHCDRGSALANLGRYAEALQDVDIALLLRPQFPEAQFARGFVLTCVKGFDKNRLERALNAYEEAIRLRPNYPEAHRERGFILGQLGFDEEALAAFNRAIELRPKYAEALFGKARTLCFLTRQNPKRFPARESHEEAMDLLEHAVVIDKSIIARIVRDRSAFRELKTDQEYGPRLSAIVWEMSS